MGQGPDVVKWLLVPDCGICSFADYQISQLDFWLRIPFVSS